MKLWGGELNKYGQRWSVLEVFDIPTPDGSQTYLRRLRIVQTPCFGLYLHWINLADNDRDPHDHPWNFWSLVVRGGYFEVYGESDDPKRTTTAHRARWSLHRHPTSIAHSIELLRPRTVTSVAVGRRRREWGFWTEEGFVPWHQYDRSGHGPDPFGVPGGAR